MRALLLLVPLLLLLVRAMQAGRRVAARTLSRATMEGFLQRVRENNDLGGMSLSALVPFVVDGKTVGFTQPDFARECATIGRDVFVYGGASLTLHESLHAADIMQRTSAVGAVTLAMRDQGIIKGWRDELLPVVESFSSQPVLLMERAAYPFFGMKGYGVHVNGFCRTTENELRLWVATRSPTKSTWPGMLDHLVAGGQPHGISPTDNVVKECGEEAGIAPDLASRALPVSAVSYTGLDEAGRLKRDCLFCYDLELPQSFTPVAVDGEVQGFELKELDWVIEQIAVGGRYKPNCNIVVIDFLFRHGVIAPESPHYLSLISSLRSGECS